MAAIFSFPLSIVLTSQNDPSPHKNVRFGGSDEADREDMDTARVVKDWANTRMWGKP